MRWIAAIAVGVGMLGASLASMSQPASAQSSAPATFYGKGAPLQAGDKVAVLINGQTCGTATVSAILEWVLSVPASASCAPTENIGVTFTVNGAAATVSPPAVWKVGGTPPDIANGYKLVLGSGTAAPTGTTAPGAANTSGLISGSIPKSGGYGIIAVVSAAPAQQIASATGCPTTSMALYATVGGAFVAYVPGTTIAAVNAGFLAAFPNGTLSAGTALIGKCV